MKTQEIFIPHLNCNITYFVGSNAIQNFEIIDNACENDLWFHVNNRPSCHIIAQIPRDIPRKSLKYVIKQGAILCKQNSKYKSDKNLEIIFAKIKNIQKTDVIGTVKVNEGTILKC